MRHWLGVSWPPTEPSGGSRVSNKTQGAACDAPPEGARQTRVWRRVGVDEAGGGLAGRQRTLYRMSDY